MPEEWELSDDDVDALMEEWDAVDQAAAEYLAERVPGATDALSGSEERWVKELAETISPSDVREEDEIEAVSAVMALEHADWLGLALGAVRRGPGTALDPEQVQTDVETLEDIEGEIEDPEGHLAVLEMALLHLSPQWQDHGVLDQEDRLTERGVWGLPRALHRIWRH